MNRQNFLQTGGFPLETDTLNAMQTAYDLFNALGAIAGNKAIVKGCEANGGNTADGVVYIDGEIYEFRGGTTQSTVRIIEVPTTKVFENGDVNEVHYERYVTFASGAGSIAWSDFKRATSILELQSRILPPGTNPQLYSGAIGSIPTGWQLCDGTNGTPDLRKRFIVGYDPADPDYNAIGATGGEKEHTLTEAEMPAHDHNGNTGNNGSHNHGYKDSYVVTNGAQTSGAPSNGGTLNLGEDVRGINGTTDVDNDFAFYFNRDTEFDGAHSHSISSQGGGNAHENRPPYYTLAYIIYTGN